MLGSVGETEGLGHSGVSLEGSASAGDKGPGHVHSSLRRDAVSTGVLSVSPTDPVGDVSAVLEDGQRSLALGVGGTDEPGAVLVGGVDHRMLSERCGEDHSVIVSNRSPSEWLVKITRGMQTRVGRCIRTGQSEDKEVVLNGDQAANIVPAHLAVGSNCWTSIGAQSQSWGRTLSSGVLVSENEA